jgi:hypothetical protein
MLRDPSRSGDDSARGKANAALLDDSDCPAFAGRLPEKRDCARSRAERYSFACRTVSRRNRRCLGFAIARHCQISRRGK